MVAGLEFPLVITYVLAAGFSLAVCIWAIPFGRALGVLDSPDGERKIHKVATPLVGGIAVMVPVVFRVKVSVGARRRR